VLGRWLHEKAEGWIRRDSRLAYTAWTRRNALRTAHLLVRWASLDAGTCNRTEARSSPLR